MQGYVPRFESGTVLQRLKDFPVVAILGPRQCGKTTLARQIESHFPNAVHLDLERPRDLNRLNDPETFFDSTRPSLVCLDEIQRKPELFPVMRAVVDRRQANGQFLVLGSASPQLLRQTSESLAGRIAFVELTPLLAAELAGAATRSQLLVRGGFPRSLLAQSDEASFIWRENFIRTFLERDIAALGVRAPAELVRRLWTMLAHVSGQTLNQSRLAASLGITHPTVRSYVDLLSQTFMLRTVPPCTANVGKRLVKSPKVYVRDQGILHALLEIDTMKALLGHPVYGQSWEGYALEQLCPALQRWDCSFYRTGGGAELDFVFTKGSRRVAVECKASSAPRLERGNRQALVDLNITECWIAAPVSEPYRYAEGITVAPPERIPPLIDTA